MKKHEQFVADEYKNKPLKYVIIGNKSFILPLSYKGDVTQFILDLFPSQGKFVNDKDTTSDNSYSDLRINVKAELVPTTIQEPIKAFTNNKIVKKIKQNIDPTSSQIKLDNFFINPTPKQILNNVSQKKIVERALRTARRHYLSAIKNTVLIRKEYPNQPFAITLNLKKRAEINRLHNKYIKHKISEGLKKTFKWSGKQTLEILGGATGALPAAIYYLLDKKVRFANGKFKRLVDEQFLPSIRRGAIKALIPLSLYAAKEITPVIKDTIKTKQEIKSKELLEQQAKEEFFAKYDTSDEIFYQNYKTARAFEKEFITLLSGYEGYHETAYLCSAGKPTVGYGSRRLADGTPVTKDTQITHDEAVAAVLTHLDKYVYPQLRYITRKLTPEQLLATEMFIYNNDEGKFKTSRVCQAVNENCKVREAFSLYRSVGGERSYGLINRNGFIGWVYYAQISDILCLNKNIIGSKDVKYYQYPTDKSRNPLKNKDGSFVVRELTTINQEIKSLFASSSISQSLVGQVHPSIRKELIPKYNITTDEYGKLTAENNTPINWPKTFAMASNNVRQ